MKHLGLILLIITFIAASGCGIGKVYKQVDHLKKENQALKVQNNMLQYQFNTCKYLYRKGLMKCGPRT